MKVFLVFRFFYCFKQGKNPTPSTVHPFLFAFSLNKSNAFFCYNAENKNPDGQLFFRNILDVAGAKAPDFFHVFLLEL